MTYKEAEKYLFNLQSRGWKLDLDRITKFLTELDSPHQQFASVHIAGTNGKGSVAAMLESILRNADYCTGLYTSPHLVDACERIVVSGVPISKTELVNYIIRFRPLIDSLNCTFFETMTALAFQYFRDKNVDVAVVEVGMGGRFDATNVLTPRLSIITDIALDHTAHLGNTITQIAREKAGIIKSGVPCLLKSNDPSVLDIVNKIADQQGTTVFRVSEKSQIQSYALSTTGSTIRMRTVRTVLEDIDLPLVGKHQIENAQTAISAAVVLRELNLNISDHNIIFGLAQTKWPGRFQTLCDDPLLIVDVAHNPAAAKALRATLELLYADRQKLIVLGVVADKDYGTIVAELAPIAHKFIAVQPDSTRALACSALAKLARSYTKNVFEFNETNMGLEFACNQVNSDDMIVVTGSHYTVGEIMNSRKKC